jgi:carbamoyl-phosphate synthase large subunit
VVPPPTLGEATVAVIEGHTRAIADALEVKGPLNVQFAVQRGPAGLPQVFVIEANPRASRTVPFVSKATGVPLAKVAARVMAGATLATLRAEGLLNPPVTGYVSVKEAVLPFDRFPDADSLLGPEMRSTGEVMGIDATFGLAFAKSQLAAGDNLADGGTVFFSVADRDKPAGLEAAARFVAAGFTIAATSGTAEYLEKAGVPVGTIVGKVTPGGAALGEAVDVVDAVELIRSGKVQLVVNTPRGRGPRADGARIRRAAHQYKVPLVTTVAAARAAAAGVLERGKQPFTVKSLQEHHGRAPAPRVGPGTSGVPGAPAAPLAHGGPGGH